MSKYVKLWEFIRENEPAELTFGEVQEICGFALDHSFLTCKKELAAYGYRVGKISLKDKTVKFVRVTDEAGL